METIKYDTSSVSRTVRVWLVLLCTLIVWILKWVEYFQVSDHSSSYASVRMIANFFSEPGRGDLGFIESGIFLILVLTHLRIFFGIEFAEKDSSFNEALAHLDDAVRESLALYMEMTLAILMATTVLLTYFISVSNPWAMPALIFFESVLIIVFDIKLSYVLLTIDKDKKKNYIIIANDVVFLFTGCLFLLIPTLTKFNWHIPNGSFGPAVGIYTFILIMEIFTQYYKAVKKSYMDTMPALKLFFKAFCGGEH